MVDNSPKMSNIDGIACNSETKLGICRNLVSILCRPVDELETDSGEGVQNALDSQFVCAASRNCATFEGIGNCCYGAMVGILYEMCHIFCISGYFEVETGTCWNLYVITSPVLKHKIRVWRCCQYACGTQRIDSSSRDLSTVSWVCVYCNGVFRNDFVKLCHQSAISCHGKGVIGISGDLRTILCPP